MYNHIAIITIDHHFTINIIINIITTTIIKIIINIIIDTIIRRILTSSIIKTTIFFIIISNHKWKNNSSYKTNPKKTCLISFLTSTSTV